MKFESYSLVYIDDMEDFEEMSSIVNINAQLLDQSALPPPHQGATWRNEDWSAQSGLPPSSQLRKNHLSDPQEGSL